MIAYNPYPQSPPSPSGLPSEATPPPRRSNKNDQRIRELSMYSHFIGFHPHPRHSFVPFAPFRPLRDSRPLVFVGSFHGFSTHSHPLFTLPSLFPAVSVLLHRYPTHIFSERVVETDANADGSAFSRTYSPQTIEHHLLLDMR